MTSTVILKIKNKNDDFGYLCIRFFDGNGNRLITSLKEKIPVSDFDKYFDKGFQRFNKKFEHHKRLNEKISSNIDIDVFSTSKTPISSEKSFIEYFSKYLQLIPNENTKNSYNAVLVKLELYLLSVNKTDLLFTDIDNIFVIELRNYLLTKIAGSTTKQYLNILKTVLNYAKRDGLFLEKYNYFSKLNITTNYSNKKILKIDDILRLFKIERNANNQPNKHFYTRNMLLMSILCSGIRVSDLFFIKNKDIDFTDKVVNITTKKTSVNLRVPFNDKLIKILVDIFNSFDNTVPMGHGSYGAAFIEDKKNINVDFNLKYLQEHVKSLPENDYIFKEFISREKSLLNYDKLKEESKEQNMAMVRLRVTYNYKLKTLAKVYNLDLKDISSHAGRYSWTNLLLDIENVNIVDIQRSLGHKRINTTMNYLDRHFSLDKLTNIGSSLSDKIKL